jgi:hypothetical protein
MMPEGRNSGDRDIHFRQRLGKHIPVATDTYATIDELLETVFSVRSVPKSSKSLVESWQSYFLVNHEHGNTGISVVRGCYRATTNDDNRLRRLDLCSSEL